MSGALDIADSKVDDPEIMKDARVYLLADSYMLQGLKELSLEKFRLSFAALWASDELAECIAEIYGNTVHEDNGIRDAVIATVQKHCRQLLSNDAFRNLIESGGELAFDLISALSANIHNWY